MRLSDGIGDHQITRARRHTVGFIFSRYFSVSCSGVADCRGLAGENDQRPLSGCGPPPGKLRHVDRLRRAPRRIVDDDPATRPIVSDADDNDVVVAMASIGEEDDDRLTCRDSRGEGGNRTARRLGSPASSTHRGDQRVVGYSGDAARSALHQRRELPDVGTCLAPVSEYHRHRRAAAERLGLREKRHVDHWCR